MNRPNAHDNAQDSYRDLEKALARIEAPPPPVDLPSRCLSTIAVQQNGKQAKHYWCDRRFT